MRNTLPFSPLWTGKEGGSKSKGIRISVEGRKKEKKEERLYAQEKGWPMIFQTPDFKF